MQLYDVLQVCCINLQVGSASSNIPICIRQGRAHPAACVLCGATHSCATITNKIEVMGSQTDFSGRLIEREQPLLIDFCERLGMLKTPSNMTWLKSGPEFCTRPSPNIHTTYSRSQDV
jgi:hypothetical protein